MINKDRKVNRIFLFTISISFVIALTGCQAIISRQASSPTDNLSIQIETTPTPEELEIKNELMPTSDKYAVQGISPGGFLPVLEDHFLDSSPLGSIPSYGANIIPTSNILEIGDMFWLQVQYQDLIGWVDFTYLAVQQGQLPDELIDLGQNIIFLLKNYQYGTLQTLVHPELCLRFSPYPYLSQNNMIFCGQDINDSATSDAKFSWGRFDGTGDPISLTFRDYHERFVYDENYLRSPVVGFNIEVSSGNSINNIGEVFAESIMIEYHFPFIDPQYAGMDWRSLRLVFVQEGESWYLVAIIHGEWTI